MVDRGQRALGDEARPSVSFFFEMLDRLGDRDNGSVG